MLSLVELAQDLLDHLLVFQADGKEDCFHGKGMGLVHCGMGVKLCPVEEAVKRLLVFLAQGPAETFPGFLFPFQNVTVRQDSAAHLSFQIARGQYSSGAISRLNLADVRMIQNSSYDELSIKINREEGGASVVQLDFTHRRRYYWLISTKIEPVVVGGVL